MTYEGYLKGYVPEIIRLHDQGLTPSDIARALDLHATFGPNSGMVRYILIKEGYVPPQPYEHLKAWRKARREHALMLRCEGLTFREVGARLGVSRDRARQISDNGARELAKAMRRTRWEIAR